MRDVDVLSLDARKRIYDFVKEHPGTHLREIARSLELPLGTALYHLDHLVTREVLSPRQDGRYKRFFLRNSMGRKEKDHVTMFRHSVPRRIAEALLALGDGTQRVLSASLGVSRSTLSFHLTTMVAEGVVACEDRRPEKVYRLADVALSRQILEGFRQSFERETTVPILAQALGDAEPAPVA